MDCPQQVWSNGSDEASVLVAVEWRHPLNGLSTTSDEPQDAEQDVDIAERRRLGHAAALLNCLMVAAMYDERIDASAVAKIACSLVSKAIDRLDSVELPRALEGRSAQTPP
jgi:hypothetical protein